MEKYKGWIIIAASFIASEAVMIAGFAVIIGIIWR